MQESLKKTWDEELQGDDWSGVDWLVDELPESEVPLVKLVLWLVVPFVVLFVLLVWLLGGGGGGVTTIRMHFPPVSVYSLVQSVHLSSPTALHSLQGLVQGLHSVWSR